MLIKVLNRGSEVKRLFRTTPTRCVFMDREAEVLQKRGEGKLAEENIQRDWKYGLGEKITKK